MSSFTFPITEECLHFVLFFSLPDFFRAIFSLCLSPIDFICDLQFHRYHSVTLETTTCYGEVIANMCCYCQNILLRRAQNGPHFIMSDF